VRKALNGARFLFVPLAMVGTQRFKREKEKRVGFESEKSLGFREKSLSLFPRSRLWNGLLVSLGFTVCSILWFASSGNPPHAGISGSTGSNGSEAVRGLVVSSVGEADTIDAKGTGSSATSGWQRAKLFPEELSIPGNLKLNYSTDGYYPTFDSLVGDVVPGNTRLLSKMRFPPVPVQLLISQFAEVPLKRFRRHRGGTGRCPEYSPRFKYLGCANLAPDSQVLEDQC